MAPRFVKKLKSMAKGLVEKIAGTLTKPTKDDNKSSYEATRHSLTASPAIRPRTHSEEQDEKERAGLPRTSPAVRRMTLDD